METVNIGTLVELRASDGNYLTESYPTYFHTFVTKKILVGKDSIDNYKEITAAEKDELEASDEKYERPPQSFIDMWNSKANYGTFGIYNESTGYFELNEIYDIDYKEARDIYSDSFPSLCGNMTHNFYAYSYPRGRTLFPTKGSGYNDQNSMFKYCRKLVHIRLIDGYSNDKASYSSIASMFTYCGNLKKVIGVLELAGSNTSNAFTQCQSLEEIDIKIISNTEVRFDLCNSPKLSLRSVQSLVTLKQNTNKVVVILHSDIYNKLTDELIEAALEKNITFATI